MPRSLNKAQIIGRLGRDPESRTFGNGGSVVTFPVATSDTWRDRNSGEQRERTEWHRVAIYNERLGQLAQTYLSKGDQVFLEGKMETRKWTDQNGSERYTTEIALRPYAGEMMFLTPRKNNAPRAEASGRSGSAPRDNSGYDVQEDLYAAARTSEGYGGGHGPARPVRSRRGHSPDIEDDIPF